MMRGLLCTIFFCSCVELRDQTASGRPKQSRMHFCTSQVQALQCATTFVCPLAFSAFCAL